MNSFRATARAVRPAVARSIARPCVASAATALQVRHESSTVSSTAAHAGDSRDHKSPFAGAGSRDTTKIPDFSKYRNSSFKGGQVFGYFMAGTMGVLSAAGAKATVQGTLPARRRRVSCVAANGGD